MSLREKGYVCKECGDITEALELDRHFGKKRDNINCNSCGEIIVIDEAEKVYSGGEIRSEIRKQFDLIDSIGKKTEANTLERKELVGKRKSLMNLVRRFNWSENFRRELGIKCLHSDDDSGESDT